MKRTLMSFVTITVVALAGCSSETPEPEIVTTTVTTTQQPLAPRLTTKNPTPTENPFKYRMNEPVAIQSCKIDAIKQLERPNDERGEFINIEANERSWGWSITMDLEFLGEVYPIDCMVNTAGKRSITSSVISDSQ